MIFPKLIKSGSLSLLLLIFLWAEISAQVVTPSLDPTEPIESPAASGWRKVKAIGMGYLENSGNRTLLEDQLYEFDGTGARINAAFSAGNFFFEVYSDQSTTKVKLEQYYEGVFNQSRTESRGFLTLRGNDFVSIGMGGRSVESKDYISAAFPEEKNKQQSSMGNLSLAISDMIFIGGGVERVKETTAYMTPNNWNNTTGGLALRIGEPGEFRLRIEASSTSSPKTEKDAKADNIQSIHPQTTVTRAAAEIMFSGLLFSAYSETKKIDETYTDPVTQLPVNGVEEKLTKSGVLWVPAEGLVLGFYFINTEANRGFVDKFSQFQTKLGYIF